MVRAMAALRLLRAREQEPGFVSAGTYIGLYEHSGSKTMKVLLLLGPLSWGVAANAGIAAAAPETLILTPANMLAQTHSRAGNHDRQQHLPAAFGHA